MPFETPAEFSNIRMVSQQLSGTRISNGSEMISWFGAIQGQEYALTKWAVGLRMPNLTEADIEKELSEGKILRTHLMRSTWHFVHADDIRWILKLTGPRVDAKNVFMYRKLELDQQVFNRSAVILRKFLKGKQLTRAEIGKVLEQNKINAAGMRLGYILMKAEIDGIICSGARKGNQFSYALVEDRAPLATIKNEDEALSALTIRYFRARGPATINDFATWSALTISQCRRGLDLVSKQFEMIKLDSREYYFINEGKFRLPLPERVFLLPVYDEFIMGYKDRSAMFENLGKSYTSSDLIFNSMILYKGQVIGTWRRVPERKRITIGLRYFKSISKKVQEQIEFETDRFAGFYGLPVITSE